jgi:hypothetical protein
VPASSTAFRPEYGEEVSETLDLLERRMKGEDVTEALEGYWDKLGFVNGTDDPVYLALSWLGAATKAPNKVLARAQIRAALRSLREIEHTAPVPNDSVMPEMYCFPC